MRFNRKYKALIKSNNRFDILEGTTYSGKTTVGAGVKFMLEVAKSEKRLHGIAGKDLGVVEKNIIQAEAGILAEWGDYVKYRGHGTADIKLPHIEFYQPDGSIKIIYVFGYDDRNRWQKVLGGQMGAVYIDEANIANIEFIREISIRADYMLWTLNPDDPTLAIYSEYINKSRPLARYERDYPPELLSQLDREHQQGWVHWYFTFSDNIACSAEKKEQIISNAPVGTKLYKNKILGLRGVGEGGAYSGFMRKATHLLDFDKINLSALQEIVCTVDIGSSVDLSDEGKSATVATIGGYSAGYQRLIVLEAFTVVASSHDRIIAEIEQRITWWWQFHYGRLTTIVIDSAEAILIRTWRNKTLFKNLRIVGATKASGKEINLVTRCQAKQQLLIQERLLWTDRAIESYLAHERILTNDDGSEKDTNSQANDFSDCVAYLITEKWRSLIEQPKRRI